ncbi:hypothetical protein DFH07DRAFT_778962 [Mycena maculata]|uniref:Uncharacterized protein n=1 Tax=Mycena maculata TaxID=230809 RepID=A0AAD7IAI4_9AGAR|nr:hypothetical protein DFH07DRAFT_778962 [Mycena maculata]
MALVPGDIRKKDKNFSPTRSDTVSQLTHSSCAGRVRDTSRHFLSDSQHLSLHLPTARGLNDGELFDLIQFAAVDIHASDKIQDAREVDKTGDFEIFHGIRDKENVQRLSNAVANAMASVGLTAVKHHESTAVGLARSERIGLTWMGVAVKGEERQLLMTRWSRMSLGGGWIPSGSRWRRGLIIIAPIRIREPESESESELLSLASSWLPCQHTRFLRPSTGSGAGGGGSMMGSMAGNSCTSVFRRENIAVNWPDTALPEG